MRRTAILGLTCAALGAAPAVAAAATPALPLTPAEIARIHQLQVVAPFDQGIWGMQVTDVSSGATLFSQNPQRRFFSASTTKNFTTAAALDELGANHRFRTPVVHTGRVSRGTLDGDLVLVASGDLTMGGRRLPNGDVAYTGFDHMDANEVPGFAKLTPQDPLAGLNDLARQVRRSGVRHVGGDVVIDDRLWREKLVGKEMVSPIVINDNVIDLTLSPTAPGRVVKLKTRPATPAYKIDMRVKTVAAGGSTNVVVGEAKGRTVTVTGTLAADAKPLVQVFRVQQPAYFARSLFIRALRRNGVRVDAPTVARNDAARLPSRRAVAALPRVARLTSPPVSQFVKLIEKVSHNLGANTVPFWLGVHAGTPTFAEGMRQIRAFSGRIGIPASETHLLDGQGGPGNSIAPQAMTKLLRYVQTRPYGKAFRDALPIKGVDGIPMHPELDPATGHVVAKNGVNGALGADKKIEVQAMALAGYAIAGDRLLAFDVVVNHVPILGPDGRYSEDPAVLTAAFTRFESLEGITSLLYTSQLGG